MKRMNFLRVTWRVTGKQVVNINNMARYTLRLPDACFFSAPYTWVQFFFGHEYLLFRTGTPRDALASYPWSGSVSWRLADG